MKDCAYLTPDDYPCLGEGTVKVNGKWYCEEHAQEVLGYEDYDVFEDVYQETVKDHEKVL